MNVSIVMAAYNAAATIQATLDSVLAQTHDGWEAIVVDDGSTDDTRMIVERAAKADPRIRLASQPHRGVSAARNAGIAAARFDWLLFLDADDLIQSAHLERMTEELVRGAGLDAICCQSTILFADGETAGRHGVQQTGDLFGLFGRSCATDIHACVVRRSLAEAIGGFDESLAMAEDWDFWIRLARTGAQFGSIPDVLATFRLWRVPHYSAGDASKPDDILNHFDCVMRVIDHAHGVDPRMPEHLDAHPEGLPTFDLMATKLSVACWTAGLMIGAGMDARPLLSRIHGSGAAALDPPMVAHGIFRGVLRSTCQRPDVWLARWATLCPLVSCFLDALEGRADVPGLARQAWRVIEGLIAEDARWSTQVRIGKTHCIRVEVTEPIDDVELLPGTERLHCRVTVEGRPLGTFLLPGIAHRVHGEIIADAIADRLGWKLAGRFLEATAFREVEVRRDGDRVSLIRQGAILSQHPSWSRVSADSRALHDAAGWTIFLQELWHRPTWPATAFYDADLNEERAAACVRVSGSRIEVDVGSRLPDIETDSAAIEVDVKVGGVSLGIVPIHCTRRNLPAQQIRAAITLHVGYELLRAAVHRGILGRPLDDGTTLAERLDARAAAPARLAGAAAVATQGPGQNGVQPDSVGPGPGVALARREPTLFGRSASRRAALPADAADALIEAAAACGEPMAGSSDRSDPTEEILYRPELIPAAELGAAPSRRVALRRRAGVGRRIHRFAARVHHRVERADTWAALGVVTDRLPILMYHRIAPSGPPALETYRVAPARFEEQLDYLKEAGFRSVGLAEWGEAMRSRRPLRGRRVLITFDDGYRDFAEYAWPLLRRYGFQAMVFLVADRVGATNEWDGDFGGTVPLLGWNDVRRLQREGVEFGSHTATHAHLTGLSVEDITREAARSRAVLGRELGSDVTAISYPYGNHDPVVTHLAGACGYTYGLTSHYAASGLTDDPLALPRLCVLDSDRLAEFAAKLGELMIPDGTEADGGS